jgi:hypothetical protein
MPNNQRRKKDSARLTWSSKPRRAPNPKDIDFQTAVDKEKKVIEYRLPLFGQIEVTLHEESKILYELLDKRGEIERLKQIEHLGVLHKVFDCPVYTRWAYVMSILYLIEQARPFTEISNKIKLNEENNISSGEELLKCWALLLFTGHLHGTFSTERALLKKLKEDDYDKVFKELFEDERLRENLMKIVNDEELFHAFYVLTAYKTLKINREYHKKENKGELHKNELLEILKAFLLRENYYSGANKGEIEKREKLKRLVEYFKSFRELAFVILDGYYAQVSLNLNPLYIVKNLDEMAENQHLRRLIDDIQKYFYNTIYHSQEGIVSHLYYSNQYSKLFAEYDDVKQLIEDLCDNKIDNKVQKLMKGKKNQYKHFIRVKFRKDEIKVFLTEERDMLDKSRLWGDKYNEDIIFGITSNPPTNEHYGDICCKNLKKNLNRCVGLLAEEVKKFKEENAYYVFQLRLEFLPKLIEKHYSNLDEIDEDELKKFEEMKDADEIAEALEVKGEETEESFIKFLLNQIFNAIYIYKERPLPTQGEGEEEIEKYRIKEVFGEISSDIEPLSKLYKRREPIACELTERVFELANSPVKNREVMLEFVPKPSKNPKAFFATHYKELGPICEYIEKKRELSKNEIGDAVVNEVKSLINELRKELKNDVNRNFYYIIIPSIKFRDMPNKKDIGEFDGLFIKIPKEMNRELEVVVIESKSWGNPGKHQIKRIREIIGKETSDEYAKRIKQALGEKGYYKNIKRIEENDCRYVRFPFTI